MSVCAVVVLLMFGPFDLMQNVISQTTIVHQHAVSGDLVPRGPCPFTWVTSRS